MRPGRRWSCALAGLVVVGSLLALPACGDGGEEEPAVRPADEGIEGVLAIRIPSATHTDATVDYDRSPPAGGDHSDAAAPCRFYDEPIPVEPVVHALEHGAVWLAYAPDLPEEDLATLRAVVAGEALTIATPYAELDPGVAVVVSSWARQLSLESVDDPRLVQFVEQYRNGDQAPESGVGC